MIGWFLDFFSGIFLPQVLRLTSSSPSPSAMVTVTVALLSGKSCSLPLRDAASLRQRATELLEVRPLDAVRAMGGHGGPWVLEVEI